MYSFPDLEPVCCSMSNSNCCFLTRILISQEQQTPAHRQQGAERCGGGRWWSRRRYTHLLQWECQNYNSLLNNHWQENVGSHQKKIPHVQGQRRKPSKMIGGVKSRLESNPICSRDAQRAQTNLVHTRTQRPHRDGARTVFECLLQMYRSAVDCCRGRGSGCTRPGYGISPLGGGAPLTPL